MHMIPAQTGTKVSTKLAQSSAVRRNTLLLEKTLPRGMSIGQWDDDLHKKNFYVRFGIKRTTESFATEEARNVRAEQLALEAEKNGTNSLDYSVEEIREWQLFKKRTGATMASVADLWHKYSGTIGTTITINEAVTRYLALRLSEGIKEKTDTYRQMDKHLNEVLCGHFGDRLITTIRPDELRAVMGGLKDRLGTGTASNVTKRNYRKNWNVFFKRAIAEKWLIENPCQTVIPPKVEEEDVQLISIKDAFQFFKANLAEPVLPRIALEFWGFMRASAAGRVRKDHIDYDEKGLFMPGQLHKSGKKKHRQGHVQTLWDWLALATDETWALSERMYDLRKSQAFVRAHVLNAGNVFRHSCISYMLSATKNMPLVSYLAQHTHLSTTEGYVGVAKEKEAKLWLKLTPQAVAGTWEDFQKLNQQAETE